MAWNSIIGQQRVKNILQRAVAEQRIAHAYCLWGAEGVGKDALALEFAKMLNCESPRRINDTIEACDECKSCHQSNMIQHPNIHFIFSLPAAKSDDSSSANSAILKLSDDQIRAIQEQIALKSENPYHHISISNASQIRIASIRDVKKTISMSQQQKGRRFIIVSDADAMNQEAANAFLKTLEEPNSNITIILTTSRREQLLQTILSRCQQIRCDILHDDDISLALQVRNNVEQEDANLIARLSDGSYSKACELINSDLRQLRQEVVDLLRAMLKKNNYILNLTNKLEAYSSAKDRSKVETMLVLLLLWLRDAYAFSVSNNPDVIINIDQLQDLTNFVKNFQNADLDTATKAVEKAVELTHRNVNINLLLIQFALEMRGIFVGT